MAQDRAHIRERHVGTRKTIAQGRACGSIVLIELCRPSHRSRHTLV
jgi:hypothetical protein